MDLCHCQLPYIADESLACQGRLCGDHAAEDPGWTSAWTWAYADETSDYGTMQQLLLGMMREAMPGTMPQSMARASLVARLMGRARGQR